MTAAIVKLKRFSIMIVLLPTWAFGETSRLYLSFESDHLPSGISLVGQEPDYIDGKVGRAANLKGSTAYATNIGIEQLSNGTTWMAWVKPYQNELRKQLISIDDGAFDWTLGVEDGHWNVYSGGRRHMTAFPAPLNSWQFVFAQFDPVFNRIMVGVDEKYQLIHRIDVPQTNHTLGIGYNPGFGEYFEGAIDEVRIFNRALLLPEIQSIAEVLPPFQQLADVEGVYKVLYVRVSFPDTDLVYDGSKSDIEAVLGRISPEIHQATYGKVTLRYEVANQTYHLPSGAEYYGGDENNPIRFKEITKDVHQAISGEYDPESYDLVGIIMGRITEDEFPGTVWRFGGGDAGTFCDEEGCLPFNILRSLNDITVYHEFGHNLGLGHSNLWIPDDLNFPEGAGRKELYGYPFDIMGGRGNDLTPLPEFNHAFKYVRGWLEQKHTAFARESGTYTLRPFDDEEPKGICSIIIPAGAGVSYHVGFRNGFPQSPETQYGIELLRVDQSEVSSPAIVDTSPGSALGALDSPLPIGKTFSFSSIPVHLTPIRRFRDRLGDAVEVRVQYENESPSEEPQISLPTPSILNAREPVMISADISYAGDEELAVNWDLGRQHFIADSNQIAVKKNFITGGERQVRVTVSDTRGNSCQDTAMFLVNEPLEKDWQLEFSPESGQRWMDVEYLNGKFIAVGDKIAVSSDGTAWELFPHAVPQTHLESIAFGYGQYLACGVHWNGSDFNGVIARSVDGFQWDYQFLYDSAPLHSLAFGPSGFVAVGRSGVALLSTDAVTWSPLSIGYGEVSLSSVAFLEGYGYVTAGGPGTIYKSLDAVNWEAIPSNSGWYIDDLKASSRGIHIAATEAIGLLNASSKITWSKHHGLGRLRDLSIGDDYLFCLRKDYQPGLWISVDGVIWESVDCGLSGELSAVAAQDGRIVICSLDGSLLTNNYLADSSKNANSLSYSEWAMQYPWKQRGFSSAKFDDPDNDSIPNLVEYLMGTDPLRDDLEIARSPLMMSGAELSNSKITLSYLRRSNLSGENPILKQSTDLESWETAEILELKVNNFFGETEELEVTLESPYDAAFFKLEFLDEPHGSP